MPAGMASAKLVETPEIDVSPAFEVVDTSKAYVCPVEVLSSIIWSPAL